MNQIVIKILPKPLLVILIMLGFSALCFAGNTGKISGRVIDKNTKEALVGVNVFIQELSTGASTDINGEYYIINIPPGTYTVSVSMVGYTKISKNNVSVSIDRTTTVDFVMETTLIEVEGVTIVAERPVIDKDLTASEQIVTSNILERS